MAVPLPGINIPVEATGTLKSQVTGMITKFRDSTKKAVELIGPILSNSNSPRSARDIPVDGTAACSPSLLLSPCGGASRHLLQAESCVSSSSGSSHPVEGSGSLDSSPCAAQQSQQGSVGSLLGHADVAAAAMAGQQAPQFPNAAAAAGLGSFPSFNAAKKTIGRIFGAGGSAPWSADGTGQPAQGHGLIAAFRSIVPGTSDGSTDSISGGNTDSDTPQHQRHDMSFLPPPPSPGRKSTLLALCPQLPPSMQRPEWCMDDYVVLEKLYTGYASVVYKGICKRSREVIVLKCYTLSSICELYQHQIFREVRLHSSLHHENVVKLYAAFKEGDRVVMVQEYADGGDLFTLLQKYGGRLGEKVAVQMVLDPFLRVLQYLHTRSIVHRDIKPENILFTKGSMCLKLADFGLAIDLREERAVTRAGTLDYMAPEVLKCPYKSKPEENKEKEWLHYGNTVDSWAVGVLTYELLSGCPPFYDQSRTNTEARIKGSVPTFPPTLSEGAKNFICEALSKDPRHRPSCLDLVHHNWIELFRARRSMRILHTAPQATTHSEEDSTYAAHLACPSEATGDAAWPGAHQPASCHAPGFAKPAPAGGADAALRQPGALQRIEDFICEGAKACVQHSAASSPCLGAQAVMIAQLAAAGAGVAGSKVSALGPLSRPQAAAVQFTPPMPMDM